MSRAFEELEAAAMELRSRQRAELATRLIASLDTDDDTDGSPAEGGAAWAAEIRRRVAEVRAGTVELIPADEVLAELRAELRR